MPNGVGEDNDEKGGDDEGINVWDVDIDFDVVGRKCFGEDGGEEGRVKRFKVYIDGVIGDGAIGLFDSVVSVCLCTSSKFLRAQCNRARIYRELCLSSIYKHVVCSWVYLFI